MDKIKDIKDKITNHIRRNNLTINEEITTNLIKIKDHIDHTNKKQIIKDRITLGTIIILIITLIILNSIKEDQEGEIEIIIIILGILIIITVNILAITYKKNK